MIKKIKSTLLTALLLIGMGQFTNAQNVKVKWGPESKGGDNKSINEPIGWQGGKYYNLRLDYSIMQNKYDVSLEKMAENMKVESIKEIPYESSATTNMENVNFFNDKIYIFSSKYDGKTDKLSFFYDAFDLNGKKTDHGNLASLPLSSRMKYQNMKFSQSSDNSLLTATFSPSIKKGESLKFNVITIPTNDVKTAKTSSQKITYSGDEISIEKQQVDNKGNVFLIIRKRRDRKADVDTKLYIVNSEGQMGKEIAMEYEGNSLGNFDMIASKDGSIKFAGMYFGKNNNKTFYKGFFLGTFDINSGTFSSFNTIPLGAKILANYGKRAEKRGQANISGKYHVKIYPSNGGGGYIVAENLSISSGSNDMVNFNYKELLVVNYNKSEELTKINFISKDQQDSYRAPSVGIGFVSYSPVVPYGFKKLMQIYTSYSAFVNNDNLYLMFNDDEENAKISSMDKVKKMYNPKKGSTMLYTISNQGIMKNEIWFNNKDKDGFFTPSKTYSEGDKKVIGIMEKKNMRYGLLNFD